MNSPLLLGKIGVLMGGISSEREISLKSGKAVFDALLTSGEDVCAVEINSSEKGEIQSILRKNKVELVFIALHGQFGEDGGIQAILEEMGMPYTGSNEAASSLSINKVLTQSLLKKNHLPVPPFIILERQNSMFLDQAYCFFQDGPIVVKPSCEGSSIGITIVFQKDNLANAVQKAFKLCSQVLVERYIPGKELTVGILNKKALPVIEICPKHDYFDYISKYQKGMTSYIIPAKISEMEKTKIQDLAEKAFSLIGCQDFSRVDFILDQSGIPFILEINTIPGFTSTSLLPMAAKHEGYSFSELCKKICALALNRNKNTMSIKSENIN